MWRFVTTCVLGVALVAAIDGALLGGVAAVVTACTGLFGLYVSYRRGLANGKSGDGYRLLAEELKRENRDLRARLREQ